MIEREDIRGDPTGPVRRKNARFPRSREHKSSTQVPHTEKEVDVFVVTLETGSRVRTGTRGPQFARDISRFPRGHDEPLVKSSVKLTDWRTLTVSKAETNWMVFARALMSGGAACQARDRPT